MFNCYRCPSNLPISCHLVKCQLLPVYSSRQSNKCITRGDAQSVRQESSITSNLGKGKLIYSTMHQSIGPLMDFQNECLSWLGSSALCKDRLLLPCPIAGGLSTTTLRSPAGSIRAMTCEAFIETMPATAAKNICQRAVTAILQIESLIKTGYAKHCNYSSCNHFCKDSNVLSAVIRDIVYHHFDRKPSECSEEENIPDFEPLN